MALLSKCNDPRAESAERIRGGRIIMNQEIKTSPQHEKSKLLWGVLCLLIIGFIWMALSMTKLANKTEIMITQLTNTDIYQKNILDKIADNSAIIHDIAAHQQTKEMYIQSLIERFEGKSISKSVMKHYSDQLNQITTVTVLENLPLTETAYDSVTKAYKEYVLTVPTYIQDSNIRELMRTKSILRLSDLLLALRKAEVAPKDARSEVSTIMSQYGDLFDQNEKELINNQLSTEIKSWKSTRMDKAKAIIDDLKKHKPETVGDTFLDLVDSNLSSYLDVETVKEYLNSLNLELWNRKVTETEHAILVIKLAISSGDITNGKLFSVRSADDELKWKTLSKKFNEEVNDHLLKVGGLLLPL